MQSPNSNRYETFLAATSRNIFVQRDIGGDLRLQPSRNIFEYLKILRDKNKCTLAIQIQSWIAKPREDDSSFVALEVR